MLFSGENNIENGMNSLSLAYPRTTYSSSSNLIFPIVLIGFFLLMKLFQNLLIHGIGSQPKLSFVLSLLPHALHA